MSSLSLNSNTNNNFNQENESEMAFDLVIPGEINHFTNLKSTQKILYGVIRSLCRKRGYCWASNNYLAKILQFHERTLQKHLEILKKNNLIECHVNENNNRRIICLKGLPSLSEEQIKIIFRGGKKGVEGVGGVAESPPNSKEDIIYKKYLSKDKYKKEKKPKSEKKEIIPDVWLTEKEHESLLRLFGEKMVKECMEKYACWKDSKGVKRASDYRSLNNWMKDEREKPKNTGKRSSSPLSSKNPKIKLPLDPIGKDRGNCLVYATLLDSNDEKDLEAAEWNLNNLSEEDRKIFDEWYKKRNKK